MIILLLCIFTTPLLGITTTSQLASANHAKADKKWEQFSKRLDRYVEEYKDGIQKDKEYLLETNRFIQSTERASKFEKAIEDTKAQFIKLREDVSRATSLTIEKPFYQTPLYCDAYLKFTEDFIKYLKDFLMIQEEER